MIQSEKANVFAWLDRKGLDTIYPVIYIDATFCIPEKMKVTKRLHYIRVKQDTTREVLSIVNHPTEAHLIGKTP